MEIDWLDKLYGIIMCSLGLIGLVIGVYLCF
jgi:hypothetical protein